MAKKNDPIPVKSLSNNFDKGILVGKISSGHSHSIEEAGDSHRHDFHFFLLQAEGRTYVEIDFAKYQLKKSSVVYIHPSQVHRILKVEKAEIFALAISDENLNARYLKMLDELTPVQPLALKAADLAIITQAMSLCLDLFERKNDKLYPLLLKDSCNTLVALIASQYLQEFEPAAGLSRFEMLTRSFRLALEQHFTAYKRPSDYAEMLNISTPYLNECVRNATGFPVSHHIQQRIILEAKRMLCHSGRSVKEIAAELGYEDPAYFSRLFTKITGTTALAFRNKNLD